jgi:hypothetical protein
MKNFKTFEIVGANEVADEGHSIISNLNMVSNRGL